MESIGCGRPYDLCSLEGDSKKIFFESIDSCSLSYSPATPNRIFWNRFIHTVIIIRILTTLG